MAEVTLYTFEDAEGEEETFTTFDAAEAREHGLRYGLLVVDNTYEWVDSETAWDFRPSTPA